MATLDELVVLIKANSSQFESELSKVSAKLDLLSKKNEKAQKSLQDAFKDSFKSANSLETGISTLGSVLGGLTNPVTLLTAGIIGMGKAFLDLGTNAFNAIKDLEQSEFAMASLIASTTRFKDELGKPAKFEESFKYSLDKSKGLIEQFQKDAAQLSLIETTDLIAGFQAGGASLGGLGITSIEDQTKAIEMLVGSMKLLKPQAKEAEAAFEVRNILQGDFGKTQSDLARFAKTTGQSTKQLEEQYKQAQKTGTGLQFLTKIYGGLYQSLKLSESTLGNQISILSDFGTRALQAIGGNFIEPMKNLIKNAYQGLAGGDTFSAETLNTFKLIGDGFKSIIIAITPLVAPLIETVKQVMALLSGLASILSAALMPVVQLLASSLQIINNVLSPSIALIGGLGNALMGLSSAFSGVMGNTDNFTSSTMQALTGATAFGAFIGGPWGALIALGVQSVALLVQNIQMLPQTLQKVGTDFAANAQLMKDNMVKMGMTAQEAESHFREMSGGIEDVLAKLSTKTALSVDEMDKLWSSGVLAWHQKLLVGTGALFSSWQNFWGITLNFTMQMINKILAEIARLALKAENSINGIFAKVEGLSGGVIKLGKVEFGTNLLKESKARANEYGAKASKFFTDGFNKTLQAKAPSKKLFELPNLAGGGGSGKKGKGSKANKDGLADDRLKAQQLAIEGNALKQQGLILDGILNKKRELAAIQTQLNALTLQSAKNEATSEINTAKMGLEQEQALAGIALRQQELELAKAKGLISDKEFTTKQSQLNLEKIALEGQFANKQAFLNLSTQEQSINAKNAEIQAQITQSVKEAGLAQYEKLANLDIESQKVLSQITAYQGQADKIDEIQKLNNELVKLDQERKTLVGEVNLTLGDKLAKYQTELGLNDIQLAKMKELYNIELQRNNLKTQTQTNLENINTLTKQNTNSMHSLKDLAKGFADTLVGAFENGKFHAEKFFTGLLKMLGDFAIKAVETLFSGAGGGGNKGGGGGGILGGLFSSLSSGFGGGNDPLKGFSAGDKSFRSRNDAFSYASSQGLGAESVQAITSLNGNLKILDTNCGITAREMAGVGGASFDLGGMFKGFGQSIQSIVSNISGFISNIFQNIGGAVKGAASGIGNFFSSFVGSLGKSGGGFASGGYVSGGGTSISDSIPAFLSNGEFVMNADSVKKYGSLLPLLNSGKFKGFADGGIVGSVSGKPKMTKVVPSMNNNKQASNNTIINIKAMDSQDVIQALSKKETRQYLNNDSNRSYQKQSNRAFNRSTYEFARGT
jgi:hypothetical protein